MSGCMAFDDNETERSEIASWHVVWGVEVDRHDILHILLHGLRTLRVL